ncbi:MAG: gliding motility protein [Archangium sp.]
MSESWQQRLKREIREVNAAVDLVMHKGTSSPTLRQDLEKAAQLSHFNATSWKWGEWLWRAMQKDRALRVALRPFLIAHLSSGAFDENGEFSVAWKLRPEENEQWLADADAADDIEIFRELNKWKLQVDWKNREKNFRQQLRARFARATTLVERRNVLGRFDVWGTLDEDTALQLYEGLRGEARDFVLNRLPWKEKFWDRLHSTALRAHDDETAWKLYRRQVDRERWGRDVTQLITTVLNDADLVDALEKHHPNHVDNAGPVFLELAKKRGAGVVPYLQKHVRVIFPRWGWYGGRKDDTSLRDLVRLADDNAWNPLWSRLLQSSATPELWNAEVRRILGGDMKTATARMKLHALAGAGSEWNFAGFSLAQVQPLDDETALLMLERAPDVLRGPFRMHLSPSHNTEYPKFIERILGSDDEVLVDFLASRVTLLAWNNEKLGKRFATHYEKFDDETFIRRATHVLSMLPAYAIWNYGRLVETNPLSRLLFERSTPLYLGDAVLVRELLESPQIHVQALAFRVLATNDPRAQAIASKNVDVLVPTLLRPLHRKTRLAAFKALSAAARDDEKAAAIVLRRMKEALSLPDKRYPREELVAAMGQVLARWPSLRSPSEHPRIFRRADA